MDILIIAHFTNLPCESGNNRFAYLSNIIASDIRESQVEVLTSSFSHQLKKQRDMSSEELKSLNYKLTTCYEPGYSKNVCLRRFYSHYVYGKNLKRYLEKRKVPDVIYCAVPSLDAAYVAMEYARKNKVRFIIDVQDLWPEAFEMVFHVPVLSKIIFKPMKNIADRIYSYADEIVAVSDTYCNRAKLVNDKVIDAHVVFLGTELEQFDEFARKYSIKKNEDEIWLAYCGTLGHSYDLKCVIDAMEILKNKGINNLRFVVMGDGPLRTEFESYAQKKNVVVEFTGRLEYPKMCGVLSACDIAMNVISHRAAQSIINKHADYAAAGIPLVSTQENDEYQNLVDNYQMGFNCTNGVAKELAEKLLVLIKDDNARKIIGKNARRCAEEKFDRSTSYKEIYNLIINKNS